MIIEHVMLDERRPVPTSNLSLHGLVRHMAEVERGWFRRTLLQDLDAPWFWRDPAVADSELVDGRVGW